MELFMTKRILCIAVIALLFLTATFVLATEHIVSGPFAVNVTAQSARVAWILQSDDVQLKGPEGQRLSSPSLRVESTTFTSLQPYTRYQYNISSMGDAGGGSFKTAPVGSEPYNFLVYGD